MPKWKKFLAQFKDPLVYLLLAATGISLIAWFIEKANAAPGAEGGEILPFDAIVIVLILIVNAVLGYIQESKAEEAVEALSQMTAPQTNVLRDGKIARINTVDVVPGDMVVLGEGDSIPADGRLLAAASLLRSSRPGTTNILRFTGVAKPINIVTSNSQSRPARLYFSPQISANPFISGPVV